ncbi:MAG: tRNA (N(6)-L-threonylcarbamoyladenosine(37)-C(2))-methylthiotransferase MtaB [bacterium]|nr:tRNA (N(6)-L-threonylcarbamoyladenosine(37)-C(2))-methylthiotransferase MtaB [bacterium]
MKKAAFYTLGCKVNQYETEAMEELFRNAGYEIVPFSEASDVYVINTCSVTSMGDSKSRRMIRRARKNNHEAVIAVTGCYAQTAPEEVLAVEGVNLVIGNQGRKDIVAKVEALNGYDKINDVYDIMQTREFEELNITHYEHRTRAFIKIQDGCSQFCSYCIIPYARGPVRSRREQDIIAEIQELAKNGYTEFILTGIHVAAYGHDLECTSLAQLINSIDKLEGVKRIRLSSIEPMTLNRKFIDDISSAEKLCPHFHVALQSGCDATLKRMNRHYTTAQFKDIVDGLREAFHDAAITTDIMTGFPGETDEEFTETENFVKEIGFADAHVFQYSKRNGTPAAKRKEQIDPKVKEARSKRIIEITQKSRNDFLNIHLGQTSEVLFEQRVNDGYFEGKTANYITVQVKTNEELHGQYRNVKLMDVKDNIMYGELA